MVEVEDDEVDHYAVLGLPSGEEGAALGAKEIEKAYKLKARELHPDKRRDDPDATASFQKLISSYELLKDPEARKAFDGLLRARRERVLRESRLDSKRRKLAADLEERERAAGIVDAPAERARKEEAEASARLKVELARIRAMMRARRSGGVFGGAGGAGVAEEKSESEKKGGGGSGLARGGLDKEMVLKVSWEKEGGDYSAERLRELFKRFGAVEDVVIRSKGPKKKGTALIVMSTRDAVVAATQTMCGSLSNPLLVLPLQPVAGDLSGTDPATSSEPVTPNLGNILGAGYQSYEDSIMKKLQKAAEKQK